MGAHHEERSSRPGSGSRARSEPDQDRGSDRAPDTSTKARPSGTPSLCATRSLDGSDIKRYHRDMARSMSESERAARLIQKALDGLPERDRSVVIRFLLRSWLDLRSGRSQPPGALEAAVRYPAPATLELMAPPLPVVPSGGEHQTFPVRLPEESHAALKAWCAEHGFSMATVVRGLVENFLRAQGSQATTAPAG